MKQGIPFWVWRKVNGGKGIVEKIPDSEDGNKSRRAGLRESQSGIQVRKLTIWVRSFERQKF